LSEGLSYDETELLLRNSLVEVSGNARAFALRSRAGARLVSKRSWSELAQIEAQLERDLADTLRLELRSEPWSWLARTRALGRGLGLGITSEAHLIRVLFERVRAHPVERWREDAPQLEASLWPLYVARTHYLANTLALALDEPAPYPALIWNPHRREFRSYSIS
jgi:hypothetical protein